VRAYLRQTFEQVPPAKQKLLAQLELPRGIIARYRQSVQSKLALIGSDANAAEDLQREMEQQASQLDKQLDTTLAEIRTVFDGMRARGDTFIEGNFNVLRALRRVNKDALWTEFQTDVLGNALDRIRSISDEYSGALVDSSRVYWRTVIERLNKMEALLREEASSMDAATYADQREALQAAMSLVDVELKSGGDRRMVESIQSNFEQNVRGFTISAAGGIGGALAFILAHLTVGGVAAYPLALLGATLGPFVIAAGGAGALWFWGKAVREAKDRLKGQISELETSYRDALATLTSRERNRLLQYGKQILAPVFSQLQALGDRYRDQQARLDAFLDRAKGLETEINAVKVTQGRGT